MKKYAPGSSFLTASFATRATETAKKVEGQPKLPLITPKNQMKTILYGGIFF
jgi:hypothetical protein